MKEATQEQRIALLMAELESKRDERDFLIAQYVRLNPDLTYMEIGSALKVSAWLVCRAAQKHGTARNAATTTLNEGATPKGTQK